MLVNRGVSRFQHYAHETVAQILEFMRTFQRKVVGLSHAPQLIALIEATRQHVDCVLLQGKPQWHAFRQRAAEALSRQSHLGLLATRARNGVYPILLQSRPFRHLYGTTKIRKTVAALIGATFAVLVLIILLLKTSMSSKEGGADTVSVKEATSSQTQVPDWTIFNDEFANHPTHRATSESVDTVRTSGTAPTPDSAETTGRVMREAVPLPRPRPKRR
jgi:hypothetical protein